MTALEIINQWIYIAYRKGLSTQRSYFWIARDILEGKVSVSPDYKKLTVEYIQENVKESEEKNILLKALEEKL